MIAISIKIAALICVGIVTGGILGAINVWLYPRGK